jgi:lysine-specific histone demethylase 1
MEKVASAPNIPAAVDATNNSNMGEMGGGVLTSKVTSGPTLGSASGEGGGAMPGTNLQQSPLGGGGLRRLHNGRFAPQAAREEDLKEGFVSRVRNVVKSGDMAITEKKKRIRIRKKKVTTVLPPGNSGVHQDTVTLTTVAQKKKRIRIRNRKRKQPEIVAKDDGTSPVEGRQSKRPARQHAKVSTYDESALDAAIEEQLGMQSQGKGHKRKLGNVDKDITMEAMIAAAIGFPRDALTEEEIEAGVVSTVGSQEQANYIVVRNHILATWRENVNTWLEQETVMETIRSLHSKLVASAYDFLLSHGYINFGVAPTIKAKVPAEKDKASVVVIGAGLAGLAAARHLLAIGHKVVVVEGRLRPGGRVYTKKMEGEKVWAAADLGGSVVTGIHGNPLGVLARQMNLPLHKIRDQCPIYQPHGQPAQKDVDNKVEAEFNKLLDTCGKWRENKEHTADQVSLGETLERLRLSSGVGLGQEERQLYDWHSANLEYANASLLTNLSLAYWDQDDPYEMGGDHCFLPGGNVQFVAALTEGLPIFYGKTVKAIHYGNEGVQVIAHNQVFECDMVLSTVPLGVLKKGLIKFEPELPKRKLDAIQRLGFGLLNKVVMLFPRVFWGTDIDTFGHLEEDPKNRGEYFLFYSYAGVSGGPLLMALVAGEAAIKFERTPPLEAVTRVMSILRGT